MRKFLAIVKREYVQRVRSKLFVLMTILAPLLVAFFGIVPTLIFGIRGGPVRIAVVDQTGKLYAHLAKAVASDTQSEATPDVTAIKNANLTERFQFATPGGRKIELYQVDLDGRTIDEIRADLDHQIRSKQIHGYVVLPADVLTHSRPQFFGANTVDLFTKRTLEQSINRALREQRLRQANIDTRTIDELSKPVELRTVGIGPAGEERDSGERFLLVFAAGFVMYLTILLYGQMVLGAIIEEKETRIAEVLFSSVRPFTLMLGKLVGVSLVALTQLTIWGIGFLVLALYGVNLLASRGVPMHVPAVPPTHILFFGLFFLLGYFVYATIYAFLGSMVTTPQEGGQLAMPIILLLVVGFYFFLPVSQSPDSSFAFWVSMTPFFAPITMMVRIATQVPPFWQIALSLLIGLGTILLLMWIASRIYRIGMLMYGKRASVSEVLRWVRQP